MSQRLDKRSIPGTDWRLLEEGIHTCLPDAEIASDYDPIAKGYDRVVGNPLYNRVVWGNSVADYRRRAAQALAAANEGPILDVGCGTLKFTLAPYLATHHRPLLLLDRSLAMLRLARDRLKRAHGGALPPDILLLQGNAFALPFLEHSMGAVVSWGVLHLFDDPLPLLTQMERVCRDDGVVAWSHLVLAERWSDRYLQLLQRHGHVATPRSTGDLALMLGRTSRPYRLERQGGMVYGVG
ncbi:MAG: hypothetical protein COX57_08000 [Alphaproteobacteria bacterium CG_4_10_14_0_2_um_filter_63_37]|nr:MAG: hypothetical protein AUJ55_03700 [Proteobacteria bacterium CG1_02_64_396]PJA24561.1 MAG: hypothetical protein COX57_08000 [Alphaproteobacteria bacterium CG_4_10_14_0_2_um_filter_63_37]